MSKKTVSHQESKPPSVTANDQSGNFEFENIVERLLCERDVLATKMFGSPGLKVNGKVFSMLVKNNLVVKLPRSRVDELVEIGKGQYFDPGHGRLMKEWVSVDSGSKSLWQSLSKEAMDYVAGLNHK